MQNLFQDKITIRLFQFLLLVLVIFLIVSAVNAGKSSSLIENTISVSGSAEVSAVPDTASISLSVVTENTDLNQAQIENSEKMNNIISFLKTNGVEEKDIKTATYSIYPRYEYDDEWRNRYLAGYEIFQTVSVKIRDLSKIGEIISGATANGANDVGQLQFIIDEDEVLKAEAKNQAILDAKARASVLEKQLGVKLNEIVGFSDSTPQSTYKYASPTMIMEDAAASSVPTIEAGESTITSNVTITYKIEN